MTLKKDLHENQFDEKLKVGDFSIPLDDEINIQKTPSSLHVKTIDTPRRSQKALIVERKRPREETVVGEEDVIQWFFFRRYTFTCDLTIYEANNFSIIFSSLTNKLLDWHGERGFFARAFRLRVVGTPHVFARAKQMLDELLLAEGAMGFVRRLEIILLTEDVDTGAIDNYTPTL